MKLGGDRQTFMELEPVFKSLPRKMDIYTAIRLVPGILLKWFITELNMQFSVVSAPDRITHLPKS
jgi:hypothetical protein